LELWFFAPLSSLHALAGTRYNSGENTDLRLLFMVFRTVSRLSKIGKRLRKSREVEGKV
jgi:hypothetical protein